MWIDVLSWTHTSPPVWCQAFFIHTMTPFSILTQDLRRGDTKSISPSQVSVNVRLSSAEDRHRHKQKQQLKNELHKMSEEKRVWVPSWSYYWGQLLGFTAVEQGFDLSRFSRETHLYNIKISTSPTLKRPGAWPGNSKDPQTKKKSFWH